MKKKTAKRLMAASVAGTMAMTMLAGCVTSYSRMRVRE